MGSYICHRNAGYLAFVPLLKVGMVPLLCSPGVFILSYGIRKAKLLIKFHCNMQNFRKNQVKTKLTTFDEKKTKIKAISETFCDCPG